MCLYEDLYALGRSKKLIDRVDKTLSVLNTKNKRLGVKARRGDGSFGEIVPNADPIKDEGFAVYRGPIATIEIGIEVKIFAKAMIKQIDRVVSDLQRQDEHFKSRGGTPITIGIAGINHAEKYSSFEGEREFPTDGSSTYRHPIQEATVAEQHLVERVASAFDEFLILKFIATNQPPYPFRWIEESETEMEYGAALARVSRQYEQRF